MKILNVPYFDVNAIAEELDIRFVGTDDGPSRNYRYRVHGVLRPQHDKPNPYQRLSASWMHDERRVAAICWHGHRDFMRAIFDKYPHATIVTNWYGPVRYRGIEEFNEKHEETAYRNVGAPIFPRMACEICSCGKEGTTY